MYDTWWISHGGRYIGFAIQSDLVEGEAIIADGYYVEKRGKMYKRYFNVLGMDPRYNVIWCVNPFYKDLYNA